MSDTTDQDRHYLFHAVYIVLIAVKTDLTSSQHDQWLSSLQQATLVLQALQADRSARRCLEIVQTLCPSPTTSAEPISTFSDADFLRLFEAEFCQIPLESNPLVENDQSVHPRGPEKLIVADGDRGSWNPL